VQKSCIKKLQGTLYGNKRGNINERQCNRTQRKESNYEKKT